MKNILYLLFTLFIFTACKDSDESTPQASYFVKYEVVSENYMGRIEQTVSFTKADGGTQTVTLRATSKHNYSVIEGAFAKGTTVNLRVSAASRNALSIHVAKGSEPFVLKAYREGSNVYALSYTIDDK